MAERVIAFKGFNGRLYATEKTADGSFYEEPLRQLKERLGAAMRYDHGPCAFQMADIVVRQRPLIEEYFKLLDKVYPDG